MQQPVDTSVLCMVQTEMAGVIQAATIVALAMCMMARVSGFCEICHLRNDHTKDYATPFADPAEDFKYCRQWQDNACCTKESVEK